MGAGAGEGKYFIDYKASREFVLVRFADISTPTLLHKI